MSISNKRNIHNLNLPVLSASQEKGMILRSENGIDIKYDQNKINTYKIVNSGDYVVHLRSFQGGFAFSTIDGICSPAYTILKCNPEMIEYGFFEQYFTSKKFIDNLRIVTYGIRDGRSISVEEFLNLKGTFPNKNEQLKIIKFYTLINKRIDTQSKIIEDLELLEKEINNTIINKLVKYKDLVKFSSLYNFAKEGGTPNTSHPEYYTKGSIPFVKIDDLTTKYLVSNQSFITKLGLENSSAWLIPANSILYSNGATIGAISINKYPVTTKQGILGIVPKSDYLSEYLYYFLRSNYFKKEICKITTQGTMKSAYIKDIDNILVPRINKKQQNEILTLLSEITLKIQKEKDMLELYKKQKTYLLKNMFI